MILFGGYSAYGNVYTDIEVFFPGSFETGEWKCGQTGDSSTTTSDDVEILGEYNVEPANLWSVQDSGCILYFSMRSMFRLSIAS